MATQSDLERAIARFTTDLVDLIRVAVTEAIAETQPAPARGRPRAEAKAAGGRRGRPRGPARGGAESDLESQILNALGQAKGSLSATDIQAQLRAEAGPVRYAIKKLKTAGQLRQEGERRGARYTVKR